MFRNSFVKPSLIVLALFLCCVPSFCSDSIVQVRDICSKHYRNPHNCAIILNSIPGVTTRGIVLGKISLDLINLARDHALHTIPLIKDLIKNTSDSNLRQCYSICSLDYDDVLYALTQVKNAFTSGDFKEMHFSGAAVLSVINNCGSKTLESSQLLKNNDDLKDVTLIIMIVADYLDGKYIVI